MNLADIKEQESEEELEDIARPSSTQGISDMVNKQHPRGSSAGNSNLPEDQEFDDTEDL